MSKLEQADYAAMSIEQLIDKLILATFNTALEYGKSGDLERLELDTQVGLGYETTLRERVKALEDRIEDLEYEVSYPEPSGDDA